MDVAEELKRIVKGEVLTDEASLEKVSRDASIFKIKPLVVVCPRDIKDLTELVVWVNKNSGFSLAARAAGTDMGGGSLTDSISVSFTEHINQLLELGDGYAVVEPGMYYRDFEKKTLATDQFLPSFPASKNICAMGGIVSNNSGGEKSLKYGKTIKYVRQLSAVLRDGNEYIFEPISKKQLEEKFNSQSKLEAEIYKQTFDLLSKNADLIEKHRPTVSKNSTGYQIWDVWRPNEEVFDLSKLFVGAQGTLGLLTKVKLGLVPVKKKHGMLVVYLRNFDNIPEIVNTVLRYKPESFESFDNYTFKLAMKFFASFGGVMQTSLIGLGLAFIPDFFEVLLKGMPKLILIIDFEENEEESVDEKVKALKQELLKFKNIYVLKDVLKERDVQKYWAIRRESFNLLRHRVSGLKAAPFIDDLCVNPEKLPDFLPKLYEILDQGKFLYTVAGHIGDGNFHIIPLMDLSKEEERKKIYEIGEKVFDLVLSYGGSLSGEHNDGLIRSPFVEKQFGTEIYGIFEEIKRIFDPNGIFNPHKKVGVTKEFAEKFIVKSAM